MRLLAVVLGVAPSPKPLPGVFHSLEPTLRDWGYLALGGFLFLEDFGVPLPGETMLIAASLYAGAGHLNVFVVAIVGFAAAVAGDNVGYLIGRRGGRELVERFGRYVLITPARLDRAERFFSRHGGKIVTVARFVEGLRQFNGIIAGIAEMHWARFLAFNALGAAIWVGVWTSAGYFAGNNVEAISRDLTWVGLAIGVVVLALAVRHVIGRRRHRHSG
jgi:membrane protein DedA with SNARE-associated domain